MVMLLNAIQNEFKDYQVDPREIDTERDIIQFECDVSVREGN